LWKEKKLLKSSSMLNEFAFSAFSFVMSVISTERLIISSYVFTRTDDFVKKMSLFCDKNEISETSFIDSSWFKRSFENWSNIDVFEFTNSSFFINVFFFTNASFITSSYKKSVFYLWEEFSFENDLILILNLSSIRRRYRHRCWCLVRSLLFFDRSSHLEQASFDILLIEYLIEDLIDECWWDLENSRFFSSY
jgi:hypothetical protein